jgi:flagellin-like hook-associated protein FlgL
MSMFTSGINRALDSVKSADLAATWLGQQLTTGRKIQAAENDPSTWLEAKRADSASTYLDAVHAGLDEVSTNLAVVNTTMETIAQHLQIMQGQLKQALNMPAGDPIRQQYIANFNTVRDQIDQLVNTTSPGVARDLMSDPAADPQTGNMQVLVGANGETRTVHAQEVDTHATGLNISAVDPVMATNADLQASLDNLTAAQSTLAGRQMALGADTGDINKYATQTAQASSVYQAQADSLTGGDPTEAAIQLQSVQVQRSLAIQTLATISNDRKAVLGLLG